MRWAMQDGKVDFYGRRFLNEADRAFVLEVQETGLDHGPPCWRVIFQHGDGTFSEHVDDFEDRLSCYVMACLQFDQGFIEYAVWFDATDRWACMSSAFGSAVKSIDPWEGDS